MAVGGGAAIASVEYSRSPEARYPVAIEQAYAARPVDHRQGDVGGPLRPTQATTPAVEQAIHVLRKALGTH